MPKKTATSPHSKTQKRVVLTPFGKLRKSIDDFMARRPHRSFRVTRRRDVRRSLVLPGYFGFTREVGRTLWHNKKLFSLLALVYAIISGVLVGVASQQTYSAITDSLQQTSSSVLAGDPTQIGNAVVLIGTALTGGLTLTLTQAQSTYATLIGLLTWLTTVWLLRNVLAGKKVKLRDGLYNASAPILSTFLVGLVLVLQLIPMGIAFIGYSAAMNSGLLNGGVEAMLFWFAASLLIVLSLYWATATLIALVIVTLPGMYPMRALRTAGDLAVGRRLRLLMRLLWLIGTIVVSWIVIMVPIVIVDTWLNSVWPAFTYVPLLPIVILIMSSLTVMWSSSYVYLLYRKVVADDAQPA